MTPLDEESARRRDTNLSAHNTHKTQTSMPPPGIRTRSPSKQAAAHPASPVRTEQLTLCVAELHFFLKQVLIIQRMCCSLRVGGTEV